MKLGFPFLTFVKTEFTQEGVTQRAKRDPLSFLQRFTTIDWSWTWTTDALGEEKKRVGEILEMKIENEPSGWQEFVAQIGTSFDRLIQSRKATTSI